MRKTAALGLASVVTAGWLASTAPAAGQTQPPTMPRDPAPALGVDLGTVTIPELQERMSGGRLSSAALTSAYLFRIRTVDRRVHAVIRTDPAAMRQAAASDVRHRTGTTRGPLDGIPVLIKDNVNTRDMPTTAGSLALAGKPPARDATLVSRLRTAGAVILGKANLSEWANFRAARPTSGWSAVGGQTHNPYVLDRNPCGSSAGSAAGLAASLTQVAIGSETDGSIVCPAGMNGVVGYKPSLGLVSRSGVVPISAEQDTAGPMARNVTDAAITLSVLQGRDPADPATARYPADQPTHYGFLLRPGALRGKRIGLWRLPELGPRVDAVVSRSAASLRKAGATVVQVRPPFQRRIAKLEFPALLSEFHRDINSYLATRQGVPPDLAALIKFNRTHPAERTCFPGQELFQQALHAPPTTDPGYRKHRAELLELSRKSIDQTMAAHNLDAIASPTNPPAWTTNCQRGDNDIVPSSTPSAVAGYPSVSVPAGFVDQRPVGLLFMAGHWHDGRLLSLAAAAERQFHAWRPPHYLPSLGPST